MKSQALILALVVLPIAFAAVGIDVSTSVSSSNLKCLKKQGYDFAIVRVWRNNGVADSNSVQTMKNARDAGMTQVDGYIFPCFKCGKPEQQIQTLISHFEKNSAKYGMLWLDVENVTLWSNNPKNNVNFIKGMVNELKNQGRKIGFYTSKSQWDPITASNTEFANFPLWYAHYDKKPSFADFKPFGGWKKPAIKQYAENAKVCNVGVDLNWHP